MRKTLIPILLLLMSTSVFAAPSDPAPTADGPRFVVKKKLPPRSLPQEAVKEEVQEVQKPCPHCEELREKLEAEETEKAEMQAKAICNCGCGKPAGECQCSGDCIHKKGISWNPEFLEQAKPITRGNREWNVVYAPEWCPNCGPFREALGDGDADIEITYNTDKRGVKGAKAYPCVWIPKQKKFLYVEDFDEFDPLESLKQYNNIQEDSGIRGAIPAGEVTRETVNLVLKIFGNGGNFAPDNNAYDLPANQITLKMPANFRAQWSTENGLTKFRFNPKPRMRWNFIDQAVSGIAYNGHQLQFDLPNMIDAVVSIKGESSQGIMFPDSKKKPVYNQSPDKDFSLLPQEATPIYTMEGRISPSIEETFSERLMGRVYTYPGARTKENVIFHLMQGEHAGMFNENKLRQLSLARLEILHSNAHNGAMTRPMQKPQSKPQPSQYAKEQPIYHYSAPIQNRRIRRFSSCPNGRC